MKIRDDVVVVKLVQFVRTSYSLSGDLTSYRTTEFDGVDVSECE